MASNFSKLLETIETQNKALAQAQGRLGLAYEKLDGRLTRFNARARIEPYEVDKTSGRMIGYRRFEQRWSISTIVTGMAGLQAEVPVAETSPEIQAALMPHVADLLKKIGASISDDVKVAQKAVSEAEGLLSALP